MRLEQQGGVHLRGASSRKANRPTTEVEQREGGLHKKPNEGVEGRPVFGGTGTNRQKEEKRERAPTYGI